MNIKIIHTTTNTKKNADSISKYLLKYNLSPCIQIFPKINSIYKWKGKIKQTKEILISIKTCEKNVEQCKNIIIKHHNYEIPELIISNFKIATEDYTKWFKENTD